MIPARFAEGSDELRTGLWRPTLEDENGKTLAGFGFLAKPTRLAIVLWLLVFFIDDSLRARIAGRPRCFRNAWKMDLRE
jgi:hypothetical protein